MGSILYYLIVASVVVIWLWILLKLSSSQSLIAKLDLFIAIFVIAWLISVYPLSPFHVMSFYNGTMVPEGALARAIVYGVLFVILRKWFGNILKSIPDLFKNPFTGLLIFWCLLSSLWSETPLISLRFNLTTILFSCVVAHLAKRYSFKQLFLLLRWILLVGCFISLIGISIGRFLPGGLAFDPKGLGPLLGVNAALWMASAVFSPKHRWLKVAVSVASMAAISSSVNATFYSFSVVALVLFLAPLKRLKFRQGVILIWVYLITVIPLVILIQTYWVQILAFFGKSPHLTGRGTVVWPQFMAAVARKPWLGYGYGGYFQEWRVANDPSIRLDWISVVFRSAHNNFIECMLNIGIIGLALYLLALVSLLFLTIKYFYVASSLQEPAVPLVLLVSGVLYGMAESSGISGFYNTYIFWMFFILVQVRLNIDLKEFDGQVSRASKILYRQPNYKVSKANST